MLIKIFRCTYFFSSIFQFYHFQALFKIDQQHKNLYILWHQYSIHILFKVFLIFPKRGEFKFLPSHEEGWIGKIGGLFLKEGEYHLITYFYPYLSFLVLSFSSCVFSSYTPFLWVFFVFPRKDLILLNLICRYVISANEFFFKSKGTLQLMCKVNWMNSIIIFLKSRQNVVKVEGYLSEPVKVISGVPEESALGPLLFLIFMGVTNLNI